MSRALASILAVLLALAVILLLVGGFAYFAAEQRP